MSYSFLAVGHDKRALKHAVRVEFAKVVQGQLVHAVDVPEATALADSLIDALPEGKACNASINGSVSTDDTGLRQVSVTISISRAE